jgi:hypothetical protein
MADDRQPEAGLDEFEKAARLSFRNCLRFW